MKILGVETSCDETAVCLIEASGTFGADFRFRVLGNALLSQVAIHAPYGGVFPNLAKREHSKNLVPLLEQVLTQANLPQCQGPSLTLMPTITSILEREPELRAQLKVFLETRGNPSIDAIAVTHGPGLEPALWVGVNFAKALSLAWDIPIVPVNHLEGHLIMAMVDVGHPMSYIKSIEFPSLGLIISGGHTELGLIEKWPKFRMIGETRDDAVGEAFDKVARMMGLPYPGGPEISRLAEIARNTHRGPSSVSLPRPMIREDNFDFSFSGLKTAVLRIVKDKELSEQEKIEIAREFEDAAADVLVAKTIKAVEEYGAQTVIIGGGVSANTHIKSELKAALEKVGVQLLVPPPEFATDNALMITLAGYFRAQAKEFTAAGNLKANGNLKLGK